MTKKLTREQYLAHLSFEMRHRTTHLDKPVLTRRYIRGIITNKIKEQIRSRDTGHKTTDPSIRRRVLRKTDGICYLCKRRWNPRLAKILPHLFFETVQIDHIVPFSKFGPNDISNYLVTCARCNNRKSDLSLAEYKGGVKRSRWKRK